MRKRKKPRKSLLRDQNEENQLVDEEILNYFEMIGIEISFLRK